MISFISIATYVVVGLMTYSYLSGRDRGKKNVDFRKVVFSVTWPIHAIRCYFNMLKTWEDRDE